MNYYQHHIGDFNNDTRHLTLVERALYRDLIELYYTNEKPIDSTDFDRLAKRLTCRTDDEKASLKYVLEEFFELRDGLYHQSRCDREIEAYLAQKEQQSKAGKASAAARARKKKEQPPKEKSTELKQELNENLTPVEQPLNEATTENEQPSNQPITINHKPNIYIFDDSKTKDQNHTLKVLHDRGVTGDVAENFLAVRDLKNCTVMTEAQAEEIMAEAKKAKLSFADALAYSAKNTWARFKADWYATNEGIALTTSGYGDKTAEQILAEQAAERETNVVPAREGPPPGKLMDTLKAARAAKAGA